MHPAQIRTRTLLIAVAVAAVLCVLVTNIWVTDYRVVLPVTIVIVGTFCVWAVRRPDWRRGPARKSGNRQRHPLWSSLEYVRLGRAGVSERPLWREVIMSCWPRILLLL